MVFHFWAQAAFEYALGTKIQPDIVFSISNPVASHLPALSIKRHFPDVPWLAFFSDPWTHWGDVDFRGAKGKVKDINWKLEQEVIKNADAILFPTFELSNHFKKFHPSIKSKPLHILPQSFGKPESTFENILPTFLHMKENLTIRYIGSWYKKRTPDILLSLLEEYKKRYPMKYSTFNFELVGSLSGKEKYIERFKKLFR